jgi:hypothetical protein
MVAKRMTEIQGGRITMTPSEAEVTQVTVVLPRSSTTGPDLSTA